MKKWLHTGITLVLICIMGLLPITAFAAETEPAPRPTSAPTAKSAAQAEETPSPTNAPDTTAVMQIENARTYTGMDKPYSSGYMPTAAGGAANVVLPLISKYDIRNSQINVQFDLGDPANSPFQFGNYDQNISLAKHPTDQGEAEAYLINVVLPLSSHRQLGNFPLVMNITGRLEDGTVFTQSFTIFVVITDGIDPNVTPSPEPTVPVPGEEPPIAEPKVIIAEYTISPSPVVAGKSFHVLVTLRNTDEKQSLNNVKITAKGDSTDLLPAEGQTGSFFFKKIEAGGDITFGLDMVAAQNSKAEPHKLLLSIVFDGAKATKYSSEEEIVIPVMQPIRLEIDKPKIEPELNAGDTISVTTNVMNLGLDTVHNVRFTLDAPGLIPDKTAFIGNIESGASKKGELFVFVGTLDMKADGGYSDAEKYGATSGTVTLLYEDTFGTEFKEEFPFDTTINPPVVVPTEEEQPEEETPKNTGQWWVSIIVAAAIIVTIIVIRTVVVKKQKQQRDEDEGE